MGRLGGRKGKDELLEVYYNPKVSSIGVQKKRSVLYTPML